jgi:hypothetical protein
MHQIDAWILRRLLTTPGPLDGELEELSEPFRRLAEHLAGLPLEAR